MSDDLDAINPIDDEMNNIITEEWNNLCSTHWEEILVIADHLRQVAEQRLPQLRQQLIEKLNRIREPLHQSIERLGTSIEQFGNQYDELGKLVADRLPSTLETVRKRLDITLECTQSIIEEDCVEFTVETVSEDINRVKDEIVTAKEELKEECQLLTQEAHEAIHKMCNMLESMRDHWKSRVTNVKKSFDNMMEQLNGIGCDAADLMETIESGMQSTSVATNSAGSVLQEIKGILEEVS